MTDCPHLNIAAHVQNLRITEVDGKPALHWVAVLTVSCAQCGRQFRFKGISAGLSLEVPGVDDTGSEARLPMEPVGPAAGTC